MNKAQKNALFPLKLLLVLLTLVVVPITFLLVAFALSFDAKHPAYVLAGSIIIMWVVVLSVGWALYFRKRRKIIANKEKYNG